MIFFGKYFVKSIASISGFVQSMNALEIETKSLKYSFGHFDSYLGHSNGCSRSFYSWIRSFKNPKLWNNQNFWISKYSKFTKKHVFEKIVFRNVRPSSTQIIENGPIRKHFDLDHFLGFILIIVLDLTRTERLPSSLVLWVLDMSRVVLISKK